MRTLVTGGARSGKSTFAESVMRADQVDYVATGYPASAEDPDWADRVRRHQERRPAGWRTIETLDVAGILLADSATPVLVDCVGLWLTRTADELNAWTGDAEDALEARVASLIDALSHTPRDVVLVTNEVGLGLVPDTASGRWFRDALGRLNVGLAERCDEVWLCVAGIPVPVKHG
ncbi:MAG: bifunctional adenosylcobinamide kinase/adenosylcobinamide-phosphate guanylyltransferase [Propionibacteriaceae bacterium]